MISILRQSCEHDQVENEKICRIKLIERKLYLKILLVILVEINASYATIGPIVAPNKIFTLGIDSYRSRYDQISYQIESNIKVHIQRIDSVSMYITPKHL